MRWGRTGESVWKIIEYPQRDAESSHIFLTRTRSPISCSHMHAFGVINKMFKHTFWSHCVDLTLNALPWFFSAPQPPLTPSYVTQQTTMTTATTSWCCQCNFSCCRLQLLLSNWEEVLKFEIRRKGTANIYKYYHIVYIFFLFFNNYL